MKRILPAFQSLLSGPLLSYLLRLLQTRCQPLQAYSLALQRQLYLPLQVRLKYLKQFHPALGLKTEIYLLDLEKFERTNF